MAAWRAGGLRDAEASFRRAAELEPNQPALHDGMAQWFLAIGKVEPALRHSERAVELDPGHPAYAVTRANVLASDGQHDAAWAVLSPLVARGQRTGRLAWVYAQIAPKLRQEREALKVIDQTLTVPSLPRPLRSSLHFAAAALLDRLGEYDAAFEQARQANTLGARPFDPAAHSKWVAHQIEYFTPERLARLPRAAVDTRRPVFIVGMPRSGTSLVEQILASHGDVFGAGELRLLGDVVRGLAPADAPPPSAYPACLDTLPADAFDRLARQYLDGIDGLNAPARHVTDKMPLNFLTLGFVQLILPDCRIIHCVRDPRDTCLSCYFTDFGWGNEFSFDLSHLASYYRDYLRLMDHWRRVLRVPILEVRYEDVVADQEGQTRRMLEFLDLPWDDRCLQFHQTRRYVATASREQVRRPVYSSSVGRWKNYAKHLGELLTLERAS